MEDNGDVQENGKETKGTYRLLDLIRPHGMIALHFDLTEIQGHISQSKLTRNQFKIML